jgi:uncharacterized zinc-type alcohol dehydrogenase-like protein
MKTSSIVSLALVFASMSTSYAQNKGERIPAKGFAVQEASGHFQPYEFTRHAVGDNDIQIDILYAGICHSDLHHVFADWGAEEYPMVPGHEIAGRVVAVGKNVTKFKVGDYAGIGCMIGSCRHCEACEQDLEQYCEEGAVMTYHGIDRFNGNEHTQGGYSNTYVVAEDFAIRVPSNADIEKVAPLMCAGITAYSPLMQAGVKKGDKVGIAGFGGLGHMGVQYAVSLGADVTVFDITDDKREDALRMGATKYVNVNNPEDLKGLDRTFDFILSTIPAKYAPVMYMKMLKLNGQLGIVGLPALRNMPSLTVSELIFQGHRNVFGSQIGGIKETQEMLDYSVEHNIYPEVEVIKARGEEIDKAYQNVLDGKVKFRYVIDMHTME